MFVTKKEMSKQIVWKILVKNSYKTIFFLTDVCITSQQKHLVNESVEDRKVS